MNSAKEVALSTAASLQIPCNLSLVPVTFQITPLYESISVFAKDDSKLQIVV